ncbi:MAG: hypothetical protein AB7I04_18420 [Pseudomonadales bacterium]
MAGAVLVTVTLSYPLEDVDEQIAAGWTSLRLYRDSVPDGAFATLVDTVALVAGTKLYEIEDATGAVTSWYRAALFDSDTNTTSTKGDPFRVDATRLLDVMQMGAELAGAGFGSECTANGTVSSLVDAALLDNGIANDYLERGWIFLPNGAAADLQRRVAKGGFDFTTGALRPARDWSTLPASGDPYVFFLLLPAFKAPGAPYGWADAARDGLQECWYEDTVDIGAGGGISTRRYDLGPYLGTMREKDVKRVMVRRYDTDTGAVLWERDWSKQGKFWRTEQNGRGNVTLILGPNGPSTADRIIVTADRRDAELYAFDDVTTCPIRLAARATAMKAYEYLETVHVGKYQAELARATAMFDREYAGEGGFSVVEP